MKPFVNTLVLLFMLQAAAYAQGDVAMQPEQKKQLNVFFSNFAEMNIPSFKKGELTDQQMVDFALWNCTFHLLGQLKKSKDGGSALADAALIDSICMKYFGVKPSHHERQTYAVDLAAGEGYVFSQVSTLSELSKDAYLAKGTIYYTRTNGRIDPQAAPATWKKQKQVVRVFGMFTASIRKVEGPDPRYVLEEYAVTPLK